MRIFLVIFACFSGILFSDYLFVSSVEVEGDLHCSDPIGNVYVVKDNNLIKFDASHRRNADYSNTYLGQISSIDVSDPLRIMLYYKDHNQIVWLDNYLNEIRSPVSLDELGVDQAELVCSSSQGGFWLFNGLNEQIQYFDSRLQHVHESMSLNEWTGPGTKPGFMIEKSRQLYLNIPGTGVLIFDRFGNYSKTLGLDVPASFQVIDQKLFYYRDGQLYGYDIRNAENFTMELPVTAEIIHAELQPDNLYLFTKKGYQVYKISR